MPNRGGEKGISTRVRLFAAALALLVLPGTASAATITPSTTADDAVNNINCTLREAVISVNTAPTFRDDCAANSTGAGNADTIQLAAGQTYNLTVGGNNDDTGVSGDLDALVGLTILGNAASPPTISEQAGDNDRVLHSPNQTNLTLRNLVITDGGLTSGGTPQFGGNIFYNGDTGRTLLLDNVDVTSGVADSNNPGDAGGGIFATGGGQVTIQDSLIDGNRAGPSTGGSFQGGGIAVFGSSTDLTVTNSTVSNNTAGVGTATDAPNTSSGGGIYLGASGGGIVNSFTNATIDSNHAGGGGFSGVDGEGGGVLAAGAQSLTFTGGSISDNSAGGGFSGANGDGGGLFAGNTGGTVSFTDVAVTGNTAGGGGGLGFGGGMRIFSTAIAASLSITGGEVSDNQAGLGSASGAGGGIHFVDGAPSPTGALTLSDVTVDNNDSESSGGGISMQGGSGAMNIFNGSIVSNNTSGEGGGIFRETASTPASGDSIDRSTVSGNTGSRGGGIHLRANDLLKINEATISGNHATSDLGSGLHEGGGVYTGSNLSISNSTVFGNDANAAGGLGGGIRTDNVSAAAPGINAVYATIAQNSATSSGGNLYLEGALNANNNFITNSIVGDGTATASSNCFRENLGLVQSFGHNLERPAPDQCELDDPDDLVTNSSLGLGTLANHGFLTETVNLLPNSPAIDLVDVATCANTFVTDQRFLIRPQPQPDGACDAGAYESQYFTLSVNIGGSGTVTGTGINCPGDCTEAKPEQTQIALTAVPASGFNFAGWSGGGCAGTGACNVTLDAAKAVTASFTAIPPPATPATPTTGTTPTATPPKKKCKKKKKGAAAAKKCKKKKK